MYCYHAKSQVMKSLSDIYCEFALVFFSFLNFGIYYLDLFLVNDGSDKPGKFSRSLYVVGRTINKSKSV